MRPSREPLACLALVLHAHLPYVRHPEQKYALEETWLFEAISECYLPLLHTLDQLAGESGPRFSLSLSLSPTLLAMLQDGLLMQRYARHLHGLLALARSESRRTQGGPAHAPVRFHRQWLGRIARLFEETYAGELVPAFARLQNQGVLDLMTTAATHAYLPLWRDQPGVAQAQLRVAADNHVRVFGQPASGIWLPECGYYPGLENRLAEAGFGYFVVDSHGLLPSRAGLLAPRDCGNGVLAFGRDPASARQVWSAREGYPGDPDYREFYHDIGFSLPTHYLSGHLPGQLFPGFTGLKYHRVTGSGEDKQFYDPVRATEKTLSHARHFVAERRAHLAAQLPHCADPPLLVCPYDAELFGHWWFEGPGWLAHVIRECRREDFPRLTSLGEYAARYPRQEISQPLLSSWGENGYHAFWLNPRTDWIYPPLQQAARRMRELAARHTNPGLLEQRALAQMGRCLLLAQASDWPFMLTSGTATEYAENRLRDWLARFFYLEQSVTEGKIDERSLRALETLDPIFPDLDYRVF